MPTSLAALLCVCGIATGQLLFKCTADSQAFSGSYLHPRTLLWLLSALLLYGVTTFGWIWTLQQGPLSRLYPWMALAFVIVLRTGKGTAYLCGVRNTIALMSRLQSNSLLEVGSFGSLKGEVLR